MDMQIKINVDNGHCNITDGNYETGKTIHIEVMPNKLYGVQNGSNRVPVLNYRFISTGLSKNFKVNFTRIGDSDKFELDAVLVENAELFASIDYSYYVRKYFEISNNLTNCTTDCPNGDLYPLQETTITLTANENYEFTVNPTISYWSWENEEKYPTWQYLDFYFERISPTEYKYTFIPNPSHNEVFTVYGIATSKTNISDKYGMIAVYKPNNEILRKITQTRFIKPKLEPENINNITFYFINKDYVDTADYIISLHKMFIKVSSEKSETLFLGPYNTEIDCPIIDKDIITIDMGTVIINGKYENAIDYNNTQIEIYLPFIGLVELPTSDFMNKSINLKYNINVINGDSLVLLSCDNYVMKTITCNTAYKIPITIKDKAFMGSSKIDTKIESKSNYLLEDKPFIYVKSFNRAMPDSEPPYNNTKFYSMFNNVHGYTEATEIDFTVIHDYITKTEIDEIKTLIENGVFLP